MSKSLTAEYVRSILDYDPATGVLTWRERTPDMFPCHSPDRVCEVYNRDFAGKQAGYESKGYIKLNISGRAYFAHRIVWLIVHGSWPEDQIDHINGNKSDNRLENLRDVSALINCWNVDVSSNIGVKWHKRKKRWQAIVRHNGKTHYYGRYVDKADASAAYHRALIDLRGEYIRNSPNRAARGYTPSLSP